MIIDMIANLSLITMFLFFYHQLNKRIDTDAMRESKRRYVIGALHGAFAVVLMFFSVEVSPDTIVDMRPIMIVSSAYYGGIYASLLAALIVGFSRVALFTGFNSSSVLAVFSALFLAAGSGLAMKYARSYWRKWTYSLALSALLLGGTLYYLLGAASLEIVPALMVVILVSGMFAASLIAYFSTSNKLMRDLRTSEKNYRDLHSHQEAIFQSASGISIIAGDVNGTITRFNRGAELMLGYKSEEIVGTGAPYPYLDAEEVETRSKQLTGEYGRPISGLEVFVHLAKSGAADEREWTFIRKDGRRLTVSLMITPVVSDGEIIGFSSTGIDVTERNRAEETLRQANRILQELSYMDGLTGISNRRHFDEVLQREWKRAVRHGNVAGISLLMLDLDEFKKYNDTYGHQLGDECLKKVAHVLRDTVRRSSDTAARYGGEEFAVILPDTDSEGAVRLAEKLREAIALEAIPHAGSTAGKYVTFSIGTATMTPRPDETPACLIAWADEAMYEAKASGRDSVRTRDEQLLQNVKKSG